MGSVYGNWFDEKYCNGKRPTFEDRVHLLREESLVYSDRQVRKLKDGIDTGLHLLKRDCRPSLIAKVYSFITALSLSESVEEEELNDYNNRLKKIMIERCPEMNINFD